MALVLLLRHPLSKNDLLLNRFIIFAHKLRIMNLLRLFSLLAISLATITGTGQNRASYSHALDNTLPVTSIRAGLGDTLFFFDGRSRYVINPADTSGFNIINADYDSLNPANGLLSGAFMTGMYSDKSYDLLPGDYDTAWFMGATSWFNPAGQADNWFVVGPLTVPTGGADLSWYHRHNPGYTDSYSVFISTTGPVPYKDLYPDSLTAIYRVNQISYPTPQPSIDTLWRFETTQLHSFAGQKVYVAYHHDAADGDMLFLDNILVTENNNIGITKTNDATQIVLFPNPASGKTNINLGRSVSPGTTLGISDPSGREIYRETITSPSSDTIEIDVTTFVPGVYFVSLKSPAYSGSAILIVSSR